MVVFLQSIEVDANLDPRIYIDRGNGFSEPTSIPLQHTGPSIYLIHIMPPRKVAKLRVDPCSCVGRFRYWAKFAWNDAELAKLVKEVTGSGEGSASIYDVVIDGNPEKRTEQKPVKRIDEHFASVIRLAERTAPPIDTSMLEGGPLISFVVPLLDSSPAYLNDLLKSFRKQPAGAAELILCDDGSTSADTISWLSKQERLGTICILRNEKNNGIASATNLGIAKAGGKWVSFIDHDDALTPCVLQLIAQTIQEHPDCKFLYTDEVVTDAKLKPVTYFFKPAFDEVLLSGVNYINHLSCYRADRLRAIGGLGRVTKARRIMIFCFAISMGCGQRRSSTFLIPGIVGAAPDIPIRRNSWIVQPQTHARRWRRIFAMARRMFLSMPLLLKICIGCVLTNSKGHGRAFRSLFQIAIPLH